MDTHKATAKVDVLYKGQLLQRIQNISHGTQENNSGILFPVRVGKQGIVGSGIYRIAIVLPIFRMAAIPESMEA